MSVYKEKAIITLLLNYSQNRVATILLVSTHTVFCRDANDADADDDDNQTGNVK